MVIFHSYVKLPEGTPTITLMCSDVTTRGRDHRDQISPDFFRLILVGIFNYN